MIDIVLATVLLAIPSILVVILIDMVPRSLPMTSTPERERLLAGDSTDRRCRTRHLATILDLPVSGPRIERAAPNEPSAGFRSAKPTAGAFEPATLASDSA